MGAELAMGIMLLLGALGGAIGQHFHSKNIRVEDFTTSYVCRFTKGDYLLILETERANFKGVALRYGSKDVKLDKIDEVLFDRNDENFHHYTTSDTLSYRIDFMNAHDSSAFDRTEGNRHEIEKMSCSDRFDDREGSDYKLMVQALDKLKAVKVRDLPKYFANSKAGK